MLISTAYFVSRIRSYFSYSKTALNFSESSKLVRMEECVIRFVSLPHSVTCNRYKSIMLQRNKSGAYVFWDLNITFKYFFCLKKKTVNSNVLSLNLKLFRTKVDIKSVIRDYLLRNYVVNV